MLSLKCRKALCVLYSWMLFISGVVLICFALLLAYRIFYYYYKFVPLNFYCPCALLCALGVCHLFLTWLAINGPTTEHDFHIIAFLVITATLFFIEISAGSWTIVLWAKADEVVSSFMKESLIKSYEYDKEAWKRLQQDLQCCGYNGSVDYTKSETYPSSCCSISDNSSPSCTIIKTGCRDPASSHLEYLIIQICITSFSAAAYQIIGMVTFAYFYKFLKMERLNRSTLRRSRINSMRRQMSHAGVDPATHI
ncbi:Tetraspanin family [Popillia japonica]|uniref:Tetraspanin family n=1 Tax=Popillia japonica TaxID=7064 RepID=A0AAW1IV05_POPJA